MDEKYLLKIENLSISFEEVILQKCQFCANKGELVLIKGESGSGKTSLLYRIALLSQQVNYDFYLDDQLIDLKNDKLKASIRRNHISYVLQDSLLIPYYTVAENFYYYASLSQRKIQKEDIIETLKLLDLSVPFDQKISTLSGGERQRLAIGCALMRDTDIIILDEPTSSLDEKNETKIFELLVKIARQYDKCIIFSSHSHYALEYVDSIYWIKDKKLLRQKINYNLKTKTDISQKNNKINFSIIINYIKKYFRVYKKLEIQKVIVIFLSFFIMSISLIKIIDYQNLSQEELLKISDNQLFITDSQNDSYVESDYEIFDTNLLQSIQSHPNIEKIYPYIYAYMEIYNTKIDIVPYFLENDLQDKLLYKYDMLDENSIILNYNTYQLFKRNSVSLKKFNERVYLRIDDSSKNSWVESHMVQNIKGVFKEGESNHYTQNQYCIYVPYNVLKNTYEKYASLDYSAGYTIFSKDFDSHQQLLKELKQMSEITVNDEFQNTHALGEVMAHSQTIQKMLIIVMYIGTIVIVSILSINEFNKRQKEYILSYINGFGRCDIIKTSIIESFIFNSIAMFFVLFILVIYFIVFSISLETMLFLIGLLFCESLFIVMTIGIVNWYQMRFFSIENILRY